MPFILVNSSPIMDHPSAMCSAWVGLHLPLMTREERNEFSQELSLVSSDVMNESYCVLTSRAIEILKQSATPDVLDYYQSIAEQCKILVFDKSCCQKKHFLWGVSIINALNVYQNPGYLDIAIGSDDENSQLWCFYIGLFLGDRVRGIVSIEPFFESKDEAVEALKEFLKLCLVVISERLSESKSDDIFVLTQDRIEDIVSELRQNSCVFTNSGSLKTFPFQYQVDKYLALNPDERACVDQNAELKNQLFIKRYFLSHPKIYWFIVNSPDNVIASGDLSELPDKSAVYQMIKERKEICFLHIRT